jgi:pyruvate dehydrogenase E1 component alpha subunit
MPGVRVDGNDPVAVHGELSAAVDRARQGGGPTLVECVTFRFNGHYFGDPMAYIPKDELAHAVAADPVPRYRRWLAEHAILDEAGLAAIEEAAARTVEEALAVVLESPPPELDEVDRDLYESVAGVPR